MVSFGLPIDTLVEPPAKINRGLFEWQRLQRGYRLAQQTQLLSTGSTDLEMVRYSA